MRFLVRCDPMPGESLSSRRYRTALANLVSFRDAGMPGARPLDPDSFRDVAELKWLELTCGSEAESFRAMSVDALCEQVSGRPAARQHPPWLLQTKYSSLSPSCHTAYCPECLKEAPSYFKLVWRLAIFTTCPRHGVELRDRCPSCDFGIWPATNGRVGKALESWKGLHLCPRCGNSLLERPSAPASTARDASFESAIRTGVIEIREGLQVASVGYFTVLRAVCQLFLRIDSSAQIERSGTEWAALAAEARLAPAPHHVERLPIGLRGRLLEAGHRLLSDWPQVFLRFAHSASLSYVYFSPAQETFPSWFLGVLDGDLRKQRRGVTLEHVISGMTALEDRALKVTKAAVRRETGFGYPTVLDRTLSRRVSPTEEELSIVLRHYSAELLGKTARRRVRLSMLRDHVLFYAAVLSGRPFIEVACWPRQSFIDLVQDQGGAERSSGRAQVFRAFAETWAAYLSHERNVCPSVNPGGRLYCPRGSGARSAQSTLVRHMHAFDPRLWRSVRVFWRLCERKE